MGSPAYDLVIFDCDGVLVDSERITARVFAAMLGEAGIAVSVQDVFELFVGRSMDQCLGIIERRFGRAVPAGFVAAYRQRSAAALEAEVQPVPGIRALLESLPMPYCVASNGTREKMRATLGITGLLDRFQGRLFSVEDVAHGKPAPDVFLHAARVCGAAAARCAVIEDTPTGVAAGVAAGMQVFGYCGLTPRARLLEAGAHHTVATMAALAPLLHPGRSHVGHGRV